MAAALSVKSSDSLKRKLPATSNLGMASAWVDFEVATWQPGGARSAARRRFKDFKFLHEALSRLIPGAILPQLPETGADAQAAQKTGIEMAAFSAAARSASPLS